MATLFKLIVVLAVLYAAGRIMYQGRGRLAHIRILHVVANFVGIMAVNALIMIVVMVLSIVLDVAVTSIDPDLGFSIFTETGKLAASNILVYLLLVVFLTAFIHYGLRARLARRHNILRMSNDEYQIFEYFIQWLTIYLVVYQCVIEGFSSIVDIVVPAGSTDLQAVFDIALSPDNLNLVLQPLLISSWILVVIERFARQNAPRRKDPKAQAQSGKALKSQIKPAKAPKVQVKPDKASKAQVKPTEEAPSQQE